MASIRDLTPQTMTLGPGASRTATFALDVPVDVAEGEIIDIRMAATDTANPARYNSASASLDVVLSNDRDGDSITDVDDNCPTVPNADQLDPDRDSMQISAGG